MASSSPRISNEQVEELRVHGFRTMSLAEEVQDLREDNERLRRVVRGLMDVSAKDTYEPTQAGARREAQVLLSEPEA